MTESERRRAPRRNLPFLRGASLETGGRTHVVVITDLGPEGAFLSTRAPIEVEDPMRLRMLMPGENREVLLRCRLVRRNERFDPATGRPAGLAVCFEDLEPALARKVAAFARAALLPGPETGSAEPLEYRILEREELDVEELGRLGRDGWVLAAALPTGAGLQLVLMRRL